MNITREFTNQKPTQDGPRTNRSITAPEVRLIDQNGENIGVVKRDDALRRAQDAGLDLIEISPNVSPPVCKISDYGKYKYEMQKKQSEARKKQKIIELKEVKLRPVIEEHDYQVKLKSMHKFIAEGNKVKVTLRFRGREMSHIEIGMKVLDRIVKDMDDVAKVDLKPKKEGRQVMLVLSPK